MKNKLSKFLCLGLMSCFMHGTGTLAADYPPALNYDDYTEFFSMDKSSAKFLIDWQLNRLRYYLPQRDAQIRLDVLDEQGNILSTKERFYIYKNGQSLNQDYNQECKTQCLNGPKSLVMKPGLYWLTASENGKVFSADWFEIRSYKLGEGRFAKGEVFYTYLPTTQMARVGFQNDGDFEMKLGFAGEAAVKEQYSITLPYTVTLSYQGKAIASLPGQTRGVEHKVNMYPYTHMEDVNISKITNNSKLKKSDFKDGAYEIDVSLGGKAYRKFKFQVKSGKILYQGRQSENTQPVERMIVSEKGHWLWNSYVKEPARQLPQIKF